MGSFLSSPVSHSARSIIFPAPQCSYSENDDNFSWIEYDNYSSCSNSVKKMPTFFYKQANTKITIVYSHGNGEDIGDSRSWLKMLHNTLKVNVIGYDYEGYGLHEGTSSENSCYRDIENVVGYLKNNYQIEPKNIILYGRSLGTGPTVNIATKHKFKGVFLEAPYKSIFSVISDNLASSSVCLDSFRNQGKIDKVQCPITIFHGTEDNVISYEHSLELQKKSNCKLVTFQGGTHNDLQVFYTTAILENVYCCVKK